MGTDEVVLKAPLNQTTFGWAPDGRYRLTAAAVDGRAGAFTVGTVTALFQTRARQPAVVPYDVSSDGQRFLIVEDAGDQQAVAPITLLTNWPALLRKP